MRDRNKIELYKTKDGLTELNVQLKEETVWLSQAHLVELFGRDKSVISRHVNNIFKEDELNKIAVVAKFATTENDGKIYQVDYYNLDVIISVGYRVKSKQGTQFRIWANKILKEYLVKGYAINEKRLQEKVEQFEELKKIVHLQVKVISEYQLDTDEAKVEEDIQLELGNILIFQNYSSCSF